MKTIVVTGAAGGIGSAIITRLADENMAIIACDKDAAKLEKVASQVRKKHPRTRLDTRHFDITDHKAMIHFGENLRKTELYGLVNNAGIYLGRDLFHYSPDAMQTVLQTNLFSAIHLSQIVGNVLVKNKRPGVIVNVSSIAAFEGSSDALYGTTKAGLIGLTRSCALTFAPWVRVNAIAPGLVDTPLIDAIPKWRRKEFERGERLKGRITPASVAASVWFLLSDESRHTTGSVLDLNNGGYFR